jgi:membrane protein YdbS with pleckstrin-like domain
MQVFLMQNQWMIPIIVLWVLPWKGVALWKAAKNNQKWWFVALLVINTMAIFEILYIFVFSKKQAASLQENKTE